MDPNNNQTPAQNPAPQDNSPPAPDQTQLPPPPTNEDDQWTVAEAEFALNRTVPKPVEDKKNESTKPEEGEQAQSTSAQNPANQKPDAKPEDGSEGGAGDDKDDGTGQESVPPTRAEIEADRKQTIEEVRKELFPDMQTQLEDADGEPIRTIEDVMKLMNPNTGKAFTEIEAAAWLLAAQKHLNKQLAEAEAEVERVVEVQLSLKDQADNILRKYGALLEANPNGIREKVYAAYQKTLKKHEKADIIVDAPLSMEEFYDVALEPYEKMAQQLEEESAKNDAGQAPPQTPAQQPVPKQPTPQQQQRDQVRSDRQDIIGGGKTNAKDPEEAEWEAAAKAVYER